MMDGSPEKGKALPERLRELGISAVGDFLCAKNCVRQYSSVFDIRIDKKSDALDSAETGR